MAGRPIHVLPPLKKVDGRDKHGHDGRERHESVICDRKY